MMIETKNLTRKFGNLTVLYLAIVCRKRERSYIDRKIGDIASVMFKSRPCTKHKEIMERLC